MLVAIVTDNELDGEDIGNCETVTYLSGRGETIAISGAQV